MTCQIAERRSVGGQRVLLVEDVVTSGGQLIESAEALRAIGANISAAICVIDREAGGVERLASAGIALHALFRMTELKRTAA